VPRADSDAKAAFLWNASTKHSTMLQLVVIGLAAICLRLAYQAAMAHFGGSYDNGSDSGKYIAVAKSIMQYGHPVTVGEDGRLHDDVNYMPFYPFFLASIFSLFGADNLRAVVTIQAFLDGMTVIVIGVAAKSMSARLVVPAAITAAVIPNFLVHSSNVLTETLFMLFYSGGLCALLWALRGTRIVSLLTVAGVLFGFGLLTRPVMVYFMPFIIPAIIFTLRTQNRGSWFFCIALSFLPLIIVSLIATPRLLAHHATYGYASLTNQTGDHLLHWVYGCIATPSPCAERGRIVDELEPVETQEMRALGGQKDNPFAADAMRRRLAIERILSVPPLRAAVSVSISAIRNLVQTGFYEVLAQFRQPQTFFASVSGATFVQQLRNFLVLNQSNYFMILWAIAQMSLILSRAFQIGGVVHGLRRQELRGATVLLLSTIAYFVLVNGPVWGPKYRMPMEPALIILFALGIHRAHCLWQSTQQRDFSGKTQTGEALTQSH
jgi:4-amino-4-deoxy-L-arabinose transferase-like glycosyltransferase